MRKGLVILMAMLLVVPAFAQKKSKAEKEAEAKQAYEMALECFNNKDWVLVPSSYTALDGTYESNIEDTYFLSAEKTQFFSQGSFVCGNSYTNVADGTEYTVNVDKKGKITVILRVNGNYWKGTYKITASPKTGNEADVIFTPQNGDTRRFSGPIVPVAGAKYTKRSSPK